MAAGLSVRSCLRISRKPVRASDPAMRKSGSNSFSREDGSEELSSERKMRKKTFYDYCFTLQIELSGEASLFSGSHVKISRPGSRAGERFVFKLMTEINKKYGAPDGMTRIWAKKSWLGKVR